MKIEKVNQQEDGYIKYVLWKKDLEKIEEELESEEIKEDCRYWSGKWRIDWWCKV
jgi:hypothetical protein